MSAAAETRPGSPVFERPAANVADMGGSWLTKPATDARPRVVPEAPATTTRPQQATTDDKPRTDDTTQKLEPRRKPRVDKPATPVAEKTPVRGRKMTNFLLPVFIADWVKAEAEAQRVGMGDILIEALEDHDQEIADRIGRRPTIGGKRFSARTVRTTTPDFAAEPKRNVTMRFGQDDWETLAAIGREMNAESLVQLVRTALAVCMEHRTNTKGDLR